MLPVFKPGAVKKHLEVEQYAYAGVNVTVRIDYNLQKISLIETGTHETPKKWVFAQRELEYMQGWRNILAAMEYAIGMAEKKLKKHVATIDREKARLAMMVQREVRKSK